MNKSESKYFNTAKKMDLALIDLLKKKPFDYITVSDLCKKAEVNRSTFYLHYENMGDLLAETTRYVLDEFIAYFPVNAETFSLNIQKGDLEELNFINSKYLTPYLNYIKDNKAVFATFLSHMQTFDFENVYRRMFVHIFDPILDRFQYPKADRKYVMKYYLSGINAISTEWIADDCRKSVEEITKIISDCVFGLNRKKEL